MSQVSKRVLPKDIEKKLFEIFFRSLARLSNASDIEKFLFDLLGPVERTMLAKRLAIALLLAKGYQYEAIKSILKVSQETIARVNMALNYQGEGYSIIIKKLLRDEKMKDFFKKVEDIIIEITPTSGVKRGMIHERKSTRKSKTPLG